MFRMMTLMLRVVCGVLWRRLRGHKREPTWSVGQEIAITVSLENGRRACALPPAQARAEAEAAAAMVKPPKAVAQSKVSIGALDGVWFTPPAVQGPEVILYLHGGGYVLGSSALWAEVLGKLALATGRKVLSLDYRLAPEHPFPAAIDDAQAALEHLLAEHDPAHIVLSGDSAGGGLALALMVRRRDAGLPMPAGATLLSPWVDLSASQPSVASNAAYDWGDRDYLLHWAKLYAGDEALDHPLISPLNADLHGLPPIQLHVGDRELLLDEVRALSAELEAAGVSVSTEVHPALVHGWISMGAVFPQADATLASMAAFIEGLGAST